MTVNTKTKVGAGIAALLVLVVVIVGSGILGGPSDKELIQTALKESIAASREGRPGGVLEYLSNSFSVNDEKFGTRDISRTIKEMKPDVELETTDPIIAGESATITSPVKLSMSIPPVSYTVSQVTLAFTKESATKWLIFPTKKWRLTRVDIPDQVVQEVRDQFSASSQL